MRISRFSGLLAAALAAPPYALWAEPAATLGTILGNSDTAIRRMARLPVGGLQAVETTDGQLLFISDTGRYVVRGNADDLWHSWNTRPTCRRRPVPADSRRPSAP
jgi:thiol:disulfide interchange protein DsbC